MPKPTFKPTAEQEAIIEAARSSKTNLLIEARAGAAKTSTLVLIAEALPSTPILCIAFNNPIVKEMKTRLPRNCEAKTMHSIGYKAWASVINRKLQLSENKCSGILRDYIKKVRVEDPEEAEALGEEFSSILQIVRAAKQHGFLPERCLEPDGPFESLFTDEDFYESLPREPTKAEWDAALLVLEKSFASAIGGSIDFDDMVYCPALARFASWPRVPLTLVDEAQDLNALNHLILTKIVRKSRIIAVGDPFQAIYGFRGALTNSMTELASTFDMQRLYLTLCFRCPSSIIDFVRWRTPDICAPEWAKPGEIHRPSAFGPADLTPGSAVICRYNAPLFKLAVKLIQDGISVELSSGDIQKQLEKILKSLGKPEALSGSLFEALGSWEKKELDRARDGGKGRIKDLASCCRVILGQGQTLAEALSFLQALFAQSGRVRLMTGHKAKGLEFERVFFLDSHLIDTSDGNEQEKNLKYVIETRSQSELFFVDSRTYEARRAA